MVCQLISERWLDITNPAIKLTLDAEPVLAELDLFFAEFANRVPQTSQAFIDRLQAFVEVGCLDFDSSVATGADTIALRLKLSDSFVEFMAAARAGEFDVEL
jgi:hypothetical protein